MAWQERYEATTEVLTAVGGCVGAAESHGMLCGMLATGKEVTQADWIAEVLRNTQPHGTEARACLETLTLLYDETATGLAAEDFDFQLVLPADGAPLSDRTQALASWCNGFLFGLGRNRPDREEAVWPREVHEALGDMAEIARLTGEPTAAVEVDEEEEEAYTELVEYVRIAVLLCREQLRPMWIDDGRADTSVDIQ
ncbi:hypothetical protein CKO15_00215 [Halorhodospira abdelmalekii]|uniref:UPF0149 family protein n=1 Tax=Halorhodospira abdelmalekii TaxID=421629 RepID=UPI00190509AF|nr:UPF0149 family protein [Halorhodospira abdelmalekii]MBK1733730.1 hypothetical protein [Halorhodospira abdelmalekii]